MIELAQVTLRGLGGCALGARVLGLERLVAHAAAELVPVPHQLVRPVGVC
jgi:hypothetical protein